MKKALITGITGQDGSYLAELLLGKSYEVHGVIRRASSFNTERLDPIYTDPHASGARLFLHYGDLADAVVTSTLIAEIQPDEIYNLGAQSHGFLPALMSVFLDSYATSATSGEGADPSAAHAAFRSSRETSRLTATWRRVPE